LIPLIYGKVMIGGPADPYTYHSGSPAHGHVIPHFDRDIGGLDEIRTFPSKATFSVIVVGIGSERRDAGILASRRYGTRVIHPTHPCTVSK